MISETVCEMAPWPSRTEPGTLCSMRYAFATHLIPNPHPISFAHNLFTSNPIILQFCTEHHSSTAVLCTNLQSDWTTEADVMDKRAFARSEFKMRFGRIYNFTQGLRSISDKISLYDASFHPSSAARFYEISSFNLNDNIKPNEASTKPLRARETLKKTFDHIVSALWWPWNVKCWDICRRNDD